MCANGVDSRAKGASTCITLVIYRSFQSVFTEHIKDSVRCGEITLKPCNDWDNNNQLETLKKVISIVAKGPAVDRIAIVGKDSAVNRMTRMVLLNMRDNKFARKKGEPIKLYIDRIKTPALAYLNHTQH